MSNETAPEEIEGRLTAQRRVLRWLLEHLAVDAEGLDALLAELDEPTIPQDHQEDPGAVPAEQYAAMAAYSSELRMILEPVRKLRADHGSGG